MAAAPPAPSDARESIVARLAAAKVAVPRAEAVIVDLANDPPLGASAEAIAVEEAGRVIEGLGAAMLASRARRGVIAVRSAAARDALVEAARKTKADAVEIERVADLWPTVGIGRDVSGWDPPYGWVLEGEALLDLEAHALGRQRAPRRLTLAGTVARPGVYKFEALPTVEALVELAGGVPGGALAEAWVALDGGAYGGCLRARDEAVRSSLVLVLPARHAIALRARVPVADWLLRAASACEGCHACTASCPVALDGGALAPDEIVRVLALGADPSTRTAAAATCIGCGICDAACPSALSPFAIVTAVKARLPESIAAMHNAPPPGHAPPAHPDRGLRRMSVDLLLARAGLQSLARPPSDGKATIF